MGITDIWSNLGDVGTLRHPGIGTYGNNITCTQSLLAGYRQPREQEHQQNEYKKHS